MPPGSTSNNAETRALKIILCSCVFLQRFGIEVGGFKIPLPFFATLVVFAVLIGMRRVAVSRQVLLPLLVFASLALVSLLGAIISPPVHSSTSIVSLPYLLATYGIAALRFRNPPAVSSVLETYRDLSWAIAWLSIVQFAAQFAGLGVFSFDGLVPSWMLAEQGYNLQIPLSYGSTVYKSNGFFLLEPSIMSQFVALGLVVEILYYGASLRMVVLLGAMATGFSGTGFLVLAFAMAVSAATSLKAAARLSKFVLVICALVPCLAVVSGPEFVRVYQDRSHELSSDRSSGTLRFITPYQMVRDVMDVPRAWLGYGPGSSESFDLDYEYAVNAFTKVLVEYGPFALLAFIVLLSKVLYSGYLKTLSWTGIFMYTFGGGYLLFHCVLYVLMAFCLWSAPAILAARLEQGVSR